MKQIITLLALCLCCTSLFAQEERTLSADSLLTADGKMDSQLDSLFRTLPEVLIKGERPIVKVSQGKLVYDLPRLIRDLPVDNAYDAIKELPGVTEMNGALSLAGKGVTVILNGQVTTLSAEQLHALLQSIPASRIANAEVMYNAPARYQVRGALINITLTQADSRVRTLQGELFGKYAQKHYAGFTERASLLYSHGKLSADLLYSHNHGKGYMLTDKEALHTLSDGTVHPVNSHEMQRSTGVHTHNFRLGADYTFAENHRLSLVYTGNYSTSRGLSTTTGTWQSLNSRNNSDWLHNGRLDYQAPFGLKAGAELTYYHTPSDQLLESTMDDESLSFTTHESQRINAWKFYLSQEHTLKHGWGLNYGVIYRTTTDHSYQTYTDAPGNGISLPDDMSSRRHEQTLNIYAGFNKSFGKLSVDASLAAERYKTPAWNQWDWYPVFNLTYMPAAGRIWQLSLNSDKSYPDYWSVQNNISYMSGYSEIQGNPLLKPSLSYNIALTHVLKSKYVFNVWFQHTKDYFVQTLYQSPDRLVEIYKNLNFNYAEQAGVQASIPFTAGSWLNSRLTLTGVWQHERDDDFWDIPFNRAIFWGMANLTNTITLSTKPDLRLTLSGMIRSLAHQGIYDLPASGNVDIGLRYAFAKGNAIVNLYCNDLFETSQIDPRIRFRTQNVTNNYSCFREFGVSLTWKFGGYKEKQREEVDRSRFK
ncbi:MAG: outer membrane beta-barrel family protein [Prevotellaceae bacterium]|jgi:hypothetical protein|nr:outer membrane beta-barrel family protein [Prevotellaceae bacterium]